jgi:hypothetical protein
VRPQPGGQRGEASSRGSPVGGAEEPGGHGGAPTPRGDGDRGVPWPHGAGVAGGRGAVRVRAGLHRQPAHRLYVGAHRPRPRETRFSRGGIEASETGGDIEDLVVHSKKPPPAKPDQRASKKKERAGSSFPLPALNNEDLLRRQNQKSI